MKILLIADGRSPITRRWISMLQPLNHELVLLSSYPCEALPGLTGFHVLPLAFAAQGGGQAGTGAANPLKRLIGRFRPAAQRLRHMLGPWMLSRHVGEYLDILAAEKPQLVHALRIPFEGMLAASTPANIPVILSTWGNDLTLHAPSASRMSELTRSALQRADALMSDTRRDAELALTWGFDPRKPRLVVPGNGGLDLQELQEVASGIKPVEPPQVINPRGLRSYTRTDTFFKAVPLVLAKRPEVQFLCASMEGQSEAQKWVVQLGIAGNVKLLPWLNQHELWRETARSLVSVSVSEHDGTPNSLLEAMALGCLPVCGDLESIREWITPGENGLLVDPHDFAALAQAILTALEDSALRSGAAARNRELIRDQADISIARQKVQRFYEQFI